MLIVCPACSASYRLAPQALGVGRKVRCARCRTEWYADAPLEAKPLPSSSSLPRAAPPSDVPDDDWDPRPERAGAADAGSMDAIDRAPALAPIVGFDEADPLDVLGDQQDLPATPETGVARFRRPGAAKLRGPRLRAPRAFGAITRAFGRRPALAAAAVGIAALFAAIVLRADVVEAAPSLASLYARIGLPVNVRGLSISDVRSVEEIEEGAPMLLVTGAVTNVSRGPRDVPRLRLAVVTEDGREVYAWTTVAGRKVVGVGETTQFRARLASPPAEGRRIVVRFLGRQDLATHPR